MSARFTFRRYRGSYQLKIASAEDLERILELEEARWAATSAPLTQLACDPAFLTAIDLDASGRLRVRELQKAYRWAKERLRDRTRLASGSDQLQLDDLDPSQAEAAKMRALGERLLKEQGSTSRALTLEQIRAFKASYARRFPNGDGVLTAAQAPDPELAGLVKTIVASGGGTAELSGEKGASAADLDAFLAKAGALLAWIDEEQAQAQALRPLGDESDAAVALIDKLRVKVDQLFAQVELLDFEREPAATRLKTTQEELQKLDVHDAVAVRTWLMRAPLAHASLEGGLPLREGTNPLFAADLAQLADLAPRLVPGIPAGVQVLTRAQWKALSDRVAPRIAWKAKKPAGVPADLGPEQLRALLAGPLPGRLRELLAQDQRVSDELQQVKNLERMSLTLRWLLEVANNFVSFPALFVPGKMALFQTGKLVLDGRELSFCVRVRDRAGHKAVAEQSGMFMLYATLTRKEGEAMRSQEIAAAVTAGTRGSVAVGKRGVFYDRDGLEWDAQVVDLVVAPISLLEAAVAPFVRLKSVLVDRVQKLIASKLEGMESGAHTAVTTASAPAAAAAPPAAAGGSNLQTLIIGGGAVFTGLTAALAFLIKTLSEIDVPSVLKALLMLVLAIMGLSALLGWFKLRARDLATVLEACEWAVNARMFLTRRHSLLFTRVPPLPKGSKTEYLLMPGEAAEKRKRRAGVFLGALLVLAALTGVYWYYRVEVRGWWNDHVQPRVDKLIGREAPAAPASGTPAVEGKE